MSRGYFITLEGIEGAGKSTVARYILEWLQARGQPALLTRRARRYAAGGASARAGTEASDGGGDSSRMPKCSLMFAARSLHLANLIRPALARGEWVICAIAFTDATRAYQGGGRGLDRTAIESLAQLVHADLQPDLTLLLDLPVATGMARAQARRGRDRSLRAGTGGILRTGARRPTWNWRAADAGRFCIVDAARALPAVQASVAQRARRSAALIVRATPLHAAGCRRAGAFGGQRAVAEPAAARSAHNHGA